MPVYIHFIWLVVGVVVLLFSGDILVRGSASLAKNWGVPPLIIGLTIVALGTSAPELVISVGATLHGEPGLAVGNIVGSNIANMLLVLGVPALIYPICTSSSGTGRNVLIALIASLIFTFMALRGTISFWQGALLFALIILYLAYLFFEARAGKAAADVRELADVEHMPGLPRRPWVVFAFILFGVVGLPFGGQLVGSHAVSIAQSMHVSTAVIGLSIVAISTSLPELATSVIAALRRHSDLAVGNAFGSNIFNIFAVGGASSMVGDLAVPQSIQHYDLWVMLGSAALLGIFSLARIKLRWPLGLLLLVGYGAYIAGLMLRAGVL